MEISLQHNNVSPGLALQSRNALDGSVYAIMSGGNAVQASDVGMDQGSLSKRPSRKQDHTNTEKKKPERVTGLRPRQNSLRRVKDSTDLLREKSAQAQQATKENASDASTPGRDSRARKFTVSNVGNNGKIYLRFVVFCISTAILTAETDLTCSPPQKLQSQQPTEIPPLPPTPTKVTSPAILPDQPQNVLQTRESVWSLLSQPIRTPVQAHTPPVDHFELRTRPKRSLSQSTIETQLANERLESGAFKIVIDRPESASKYERAQLNFPALDISIPHYRLGTPRFSARGTAFFHNSVYTRSSANVDADSSVLTPQEFEKIFPKPPGIEAHAVISRRHSHASQSYAYSIHSAVPSQSAVQSQFVHHHQTRARITPEVFERLVQNPNNPAVVKYSTINGDIIAASPARIITQITSEKFLDYELLSDFFLTVRSYLSTHDLLAYLLARFEWAINRFDDRGRIIRVRAFAALRHWILNYFSYDFVTDRDLRVQFCDRLNGLTRLIKSREYSASDLKLIADLKKCWNGRCLVYWDSPNISGDNSQDLDIQPGGILGSRDSRLIHQSQLRSTTSLPPALSVNPAQVTAGATSISTWYSVVMDNGELQGQVHDRQSTAGTMRSLPRSLPSEQSNPVLSCSIPAKGLKKAFPYANRALGIHPVPHDVGGRRVCPAAPSSISNEPARPVGAHRRSGSFSDAVRDKRAPLSSDVPTTSEAIAQEMYRGNSMLRGHVVAPGPPYVSFVPTTPVSELPQLLAMAESSIQGSEGSSNRRLVAQNNPPTKGFIGNIRRALSSKHPAVTPSGQNAGPGAVPPLAVGKSAMLPLNVMYQASSSGHMEAFRSQSRIDLLAASVYDAFQKATAPPVEDNNPAVGAGGNDASQPAQIAVPELPAVMNTNNFLLPEPLRPELSRLTSGVTDSSQSIVIMDDTGLNIPHLTGLQAHEHASVTGEEQDARVSNSAEVGFDVNHRAESAFPHQTSRQTDDFVTRRKSEETPTGFDTRPISLAGIMPPSRPSMVERHPSTSLSLRRYASFQSTFGKHAAANSLDTNAASGSTISVAKEAPARMLRRRPGGDLRANQNVHDMEGQPRPKSAGSITSYSESARASQMVGFGDKITRTFATRKSPDEAIYGLTELQLGVRRENIPSYIRTHSSQNVKRRPSFEAAVAEFARIPDDDAGGVEAALLKLEGKYTSPVQSPAPPYADKGSRQPSDERLPPPAVFQKPGEQIQVQESAVASDSPGPTMDQDDRPKLDEEVDQHSEIASVDPQAVPRETVISTVYAESEDSYNSVPILARVGEDKSPSLDKGKEKALQNGENVKIEVNTGRKKLKRGSMAPSATTDSFLLDENDEFLSDVESEVSDDTIDGNRKTNDWLNAPQQPEQQPVYQQNKENMVLFGQNHPPSPPMTMENALSIHSQAKQAHELRKPPTPDPSPISQHVEPNILVSKPADALESKHLCFILGHDSELLAQQFTILEKEALKEIDWRDLVDLRWHNTTASPSNWVNYLMNHDPLGIDLVTARFNIMVKWALSEIVMTENLEDRALTIMKYIHIAHQARKLHNYATLFQFTIALTSTDCTRLSKTWDAVPTAEKEILQDLEMLVSPRRNFHNLRSEMEKANADEGCIPVIGKCCKISDSGAY